MRFAVLVSAIRTGWAPLQIVDGALADRLNNAVAGNEIVVNVLRGVTDFGGRGMLTVVLVAAAGYLTIRRQPGLAVYVIATSLGALVLDPVVKLLVERIRPEAADPVATAPGPTFPSGHALGSLVSYGVLLLIFLPTVPGRPLHRCLSEAIAQRTDVLLDLSEVTLLDCAGVRTIVTAHATATAAGRTATALAPQPIVRYVLRVTGASTVVPVIGAPAPDAEGERLAGRA